MKTKTELPAEVLEQMNRENWPSIEEVEKYWIDKEAAANNATNETGNPFSGMTREQLIQHLADYVRDGAEQHLQCATYLIEAWDTACLKAYLSTTADPKPEEDLSRTESLSKWCDEQDQRWEKWSLRDDGRSDGQGMSYGERNV